MKGFPSGIDWALVLHRVAIEEECGFIFNKEQFISTYAHTHYSFDFVTRENSGILFFESCNNRNNFVDYIKSLNKIVVSDVVLETKGKRKVDLLRGLKYKICYFPFWRKVLRRANLGSNFEKRCLYYIVNLHRFYKDLSRSINCQNIDIKKYRLFVTFYDSMPKDALFVQLMRLNGVKTASLQHGAFTARRNNQFVNSGVELRTFNSDYFLCWNKFTVDEAKKELIDEKKCIITGIIGFVNNEKRIICESVTNNTFGVVIGHPEFEEENRVLIESANYLAETTGKCYYLKLHPGYTDHYFDTLVKKDYYLGTIKRGIQMIDYANMVEFSIVGASSVFVELVYLGHNVLRYSSGEIVDKWRDIKVGNYFTNPNDVTKAFNEIKNKNNERELFDYVCTVEDVRTSYKEFFKKFEY